MFWVPMLKIIDLIKCHVFKITLKQNAKPLAPNASIHISIAAKYKSKKWILKTNFLCRIHFQN